MTAPQQLPAPEGTIYFVIDNEFQSPGRTPVPLTTDAPPDPPPDEE